MPSTYSRSKNSCRSLLSVFAMILVWMLPAHLMAEETLPFHTISTHVVGGLKKPTCIENARDGSGRMFIAEQAGVIRIYQNGALLDRPFLDIRQRVSMVNENGLLGLAFPPDHATSGAFYVYYSSATDGDSIVSRFHISQDRDIANPSSEEILLEMAGSGITPQGGLHNGGQLAFGPDGLLYISTGDTGYYYNSQMPDTPSGKILRIDVRGSTHDRPYLIPATNPHRKPLGPGGETWEWFEPILYTGLRNPWRFSFDSVTGDLYIGDVGRRRMEEINYVPASDINKPINFGWPAYEGTTDFRASHYNFVTPPQPPIHEYILDGASVTGGHVYRGPDESLYGLYIFADYVHGTIWALNRETGVVHHLLDSHRSISTFGVDEEGNLYFANHSTGAIRKIETSDTQPLPELHPPSGLYDEPFTCFVFAKSKYPTIYYTTDGSTPDFSSRVFSRSSDHSHQLKISENTNLRMLFIDDHSEPGIALEANYQVRLPPPMIFPSSWYIQDGSYLNNLPVELMHTSGAAIHYTLDGTEPTENSQRYAPSTPLILEKSAEVKAIAVAPAGNFHPSYTVAKHFRLKVDPSTLNNSRVVDGPLNITSRTLGAVIHYTLDGSTPTQSSPIWSGPQLLPPSVTLRTLSTKGEMEPSLSSHLVEADYLSRAKFQQVGGTFLTPPHDVAISQEGKIYTTSYGRIHQINETDSTMIVSDLSLRWFTEQYSLAVDHNKDFIVAPRDTDYSLTIWSPRTQSLIPSFIVNRTSDIYFNPQGGLLFAIPGMARIYIYKDSNTPLSVFAGSPFSGHEDGIHTEAKFNRPSGITGDGDKNYYIADSGNHRIRKMTRRETGGIMDVTTLSGSTSGWHDGPAATALFANPTSIVMDNIGNVYVADGYNSTRRIRKISPDRWVTTLQGPVHGLDGAISKSDARGNIEIFGMDIDANGIIYYAGNHGVFKVTQEDWDNDSIPDEIERQLGAPYVVGVDDRKVDSDRDGFSNAAEWIAGTNPSKANDKPARQSIMRKEDSSIHLLFPATPGSTREVEYSDDLDTWYPTGPVTTSEQPTHTASERMPAGVPARFYRMKEVR